VRRHHIDGARQYILTFWHAHLLLMLHAAYRRPISALVSQSRDGEMIASVFSLYKVSSIRGSSTRGGSEAMRALIRVARQGTNLAFTPDGPKGPPRIVKEGVIFAAQATGLPILPVAFAAKKKSSCARGTGWSSRDHSLGRSTSTERRSKFHGMGTWKSGKCASRAY
jgi:lysophospholipid acyltransferase (LPLAT)-like uncharacterized protein